MSREEQLQLELEKVTRERDLFRRALQNYMSKESNGADAERLLDEVAAAERDNISLDAVIADLERRYGRAS